MNRVLRWIRSEDAEYVGDRFVLITCLVALVLVITGVIA